ncbi:hypothetical protein GALL_374480 [mine drainage metagenome]|uniref:Uncharacterized protein n=1 Tax=mine drainage metagenome TaxID=410659 RepID=A0A1J5QAW7_9ZZZZ
MDHQRVMDIPTRPGLANDALQRLFGHARIMLQRHACNIGAGIEVANLANKGGHRPVVGARQPHAGDFGPGVEILGLHPNRHFNLPSPAGKTRFHHPP